MPYDVCASERDRATWLAARRSFIGASESAVVLGDGHFASLLELWASKTGRVQRDIDNERMFWGRQLENAIVAGYAERANRCVLPFGLLLRSRAWPWMSATPDALVTDDRDAVVRVPEISRTLGWIRAALRRGRRVHKLRDELARLTAGWWPLQVKNIGYESAHDWADGVPVYYRVQCLHEALVFGASKVTGAALIAGQRLAWDDIDVDPDGQVERRIVEDTRRFMSENVEGGLEPRADGSESARRMLAMLYPVAQPGKEIALDGEMLSELGAYDASKAEIKRLSGDVAQFENAIRQAMKDAERGVFADGSGFTLKCTARGNRQLLRKHAQETP